MTNVLERLENDNKVLKEQVALINKVLGLSAPERKPAPTYKDGRKRHLHAVACEVCKRSIKGPAAMARHMQTHTKRLLSATPFGPVSPTVHYEK